jgi:S-adenosylmethionine uptake transporter
MISRAPLEAVAGIAVLSLMDAVIKGLAARYPVLEITFARFACGSLVILLVAAIVRPGWPSAESLRANGLRAVLVVITATAFFYALGALPLAEALALSFLAPVFVALFAAALLKERIDRRVVGALASGFAGMAVIVGGKIGAGGGFEGSLLGAGAALLAAVTYALSMVLLRARARHDPVVTIVAIQNLGPALLLAGPAAWVWAPPSWPDGALLGLVGVLGVTGHLLLSRAYAKAEAARLAPLEYTALVWAVGLGLVGFGEVPTLWTLGGAGMLVAGALIASRRG